jgi:hypothetical protein
LFLNPWRKHVSFEDHDPMTNTQERHATRIATSKGYKLEKVGKGPHHGRFSIVNTAQGSRVRSEVPGAEFTFSLEEAEAWLEKAGP